MNISFVKYAGCGNDFILVDDREEAFPLHSRQLIAALCNRQTGIGADGVILLQRSSRADFKMRILNADGTEAEMCGNGIRCLAKFAAEIGITQSQYTIESLHNFHKVIREGELVAVDMGSPAEVEWNVSLDLSETIAHIHALNTGVPHVVEFVKELANVDVHARGKAIRHHARFAPRGTNYNAIEIDKDSQISIRTFERGVEGETLACGTGATAAALAAAKVYNIPSPIKIKTASGEHLTISFKADEEGNVEHVWMSGSATREFDGHVCLNDFLEKQNIAEFCGDL